MELKYAADLRQHPNCPPKGIAPCSRSAVRFVHDPVDDTKNFLPPAKLSPRRTLPEHKRCDALALSLFITKDQADRFFNNLKKTNKNIGKSIGDHLAEGSINEADGMATSASPNGHYSFFEAVDVAWTGRFKIVASL